MTARISLIPDSTALNAMKCARVAVAISRASVVLPVPGGPQRMIDREAVLVDGRRSGRPGADQRLLADELVERPRTHALGERRVRRRCASRPGGRRRPASSNSDIEPSGVRLRRRRARPRSRRSAIRPAVASGCVIRSSTASSTAAGEAGALAAEHDGRGPARSAARSGDPPRGTVAKHAQACRARGGQRVRETRAPSQPAGGTRCPCCRGAPSIRMDRRCPGPTITAGGAAALPRHG